MQPTEDSALLRRYAENHSDEAFAGLVTRHINLVYSVALRQVGNPHAAEEVTQAVFIILAKKAVQLQHYQALSSWLFQATRLTASNFIRSETRRHRREEEAYMQSVLDEAGTEVWSRIAPLLDAAVAALREKDRQAIVLRFYEGRNLREVGLVLGTSEDAAEKRVNRTLEKLRKFFTKRGVSSTTAIIADAMTANSVHAAPVMLAKSVTTAAVVKGSIAAASTLTLVKGTLNLMAWAKAKTTIIGAILLLAAATTTGVAINWELNSKALDRNPPTVILRTTQFKSMTGGATADNKIVLENVSLRLLLDMAYSHAYGHYQFRMVLPNNYPETNFDFMFTMSGDPTTALKNEIKKQLGLVAHRETRHADVLLAKITNSNAPGLKIVSSAENQQTGNFRNVVFKGVQIDALTSWLEAITEMPVINQTGLTNDYDITVKWKPEAGQSEADAVRQILPDQFGIQLVPTNVPIEMLVVEKAQ